MTTGRRRITIIEGSPQHIALRLMRAAAIVAIVFSLPYIAEPFRLTQITGACTYAIAVVGLNLASGYGGQISLGHAAFFGMGAYTTGILITEYDVAPPVSFLVGIGLSFVVGALVALPALRLKGIYVALVTLAVGLMFPALVTRFDSFTGGAAGLFGVEYNPPDVAYFAGFNGVTYWHYWLVVLGLGAACLVVRSLVRSRFGRGVVALRDNEAAAIVMGVRRTSTRAVTFGTSAAIASLGGSLFAVTNGVLAPSIFSLLLTLYFLAGMVIGGTGTLWGPVLGGFVIYFAPVWASDISTASGSGLAGVFLGAIIIVCTFALRSGLFGLLSRATGSVFVIQPRITERREAAAWPRRRDSRRTPEPSTSGAAASRQHHSERTSEGRTDPDVESEPSALTPSLARPEAPTQHIAHEGGARTVHSDAITATDRAPRASSYETE